MMNDRLTLRNEMKPTWLIQRLRKPEVMKIGGKEIDNPFAFGGGLKNGGLSDDAMKILRHIISFDYMGSSEFEWGAVPIALSFLAEQAGKSNLITGKIDENKQITFYLCPLQYEEEVRKRIRLLRQDKFRLKEYCGLSQYWDSDRDWSKENVGWLELDNGFMFFVDETMFQQMCKLFGLGAKNGIH